MESTPRNVDGARCQGCSLWSLSNQIRILRSESSDRILCRSDERMMYRLGRKPKSASVSASWSWCSRPSLCEAIVVKWMSRPDDDMSIISLGLTKATESACVPLQFLLTSNLGHADVSSKSSGCAIVVSVSVFLGLG